MKLVKLYDVGARPAGRPGAPFVSKESCKRTINLYIAIFVNFNSARARRFYHLHLISYQFFSSYESFTIFVEIISIVTSTYHWLNMHAITMKKVNIMCSECILFYNSRHDLNVP